MNKILNQGRRAMESNEYYLELKHANNVAYFNFKDFQKEGVTINLKVNRTINMLRYSNIEYISQMANQEVEMRTGITDMTINLTGLAIGPLDGTTINCIKKDSLLDIRNITIKYPTTRRQGKGIQVRKRFGYVFEDSEVFYHQSDGSNYYRFNGLPIKPKFRINEEQIKNLNPDIYPKVVYWIYDIEKDKYNMETYENVKMYHYQENIRYMNAHVFDQITGLLHKKLNSILEANVDLQTQKVELMVELFNTFNRIMMTTEQKRTLLINYYLKNKTIEDSKIVEEVEHIELPTYEAPPKEHIYKMKIDATNPLNIKELTVLTAYSGEITEIDENALNAVESQCQHENEWKELRTSKR